MSYDIQDEELPLKVRVPLRERGWRWNANAQAWRKEDGNGVARSPHAADHDRWWTSDLGDVLQAIEADEQREVDQAQKTLETEQARVAAQMNATPGDTGTADNISSASVQDGKVAGEDIDRMRCFH